MASNNVDIPYVVQHGKTRRYRRVVPEDLRDSLDGRKVWIKTFRAGTPLAVIEAKARVLAREHDRVIARARAGEVIGPETVAQAENLAREWLSGDRAEMHEMLAFMAQNFPAGSGLPPSASAMMNAIDHRGRYVPEGLPLTAAYGRDVEQYGGSRDERPIRTAVDSFVAAVGDRDVRAVTRVEVADWLAAMKRRGLAPGTVQRRLGALRALVNRAYLDTDHDGRNPFKGHKIANGGGGAGDRLPLNRAMLAKIDGYLAGNRRLGPETRNIMRMMEGTGAGPAEVGGLVLADVSTEAEIPHVWIRPNAQRGLKASVRNRYLPLVDDALVAARDAVRRAGVRAKGVPADRAPLFRGFNTNGRGADAISAKVNKAIRAAGVPKSPRLVAYSFRHTIKEALRSAGVSDHVQRRILGHAGHGVADRYGSTQLRLAEARDALQAAMEHLGDVDDKVYGPVERL